MSQVKHILVVDDDESIRSMLEMALLGQGYEVETAVDANDARKQARGNPPALVLCDLNMPGASGLDLLREFREDPEMSKSLFLLMTGNPTRKLLESTGELNGHAYLEKPFDLAELQKRVGALLS